MAGGRAVLLLGTWKPRPSRCPPALSASARARGHTVSLALGVAGRFQQEGKFPETESANDESSHTHGQCHKVGVLGDRSSAHPSQAGLRSQPAIRGCWLRGHLCPCKSVTPAGRRQRSASPWLRVRPSRWSVPLGFQAVL